MKGVTITLVRWCNGEICNNDLLLDVLQLIITLHKWSPWHPHCLWTACTQGWSISNLSQVRKSWERCLHLRCLIGPTGATVSCLYYLSLGTPSHHSILLISLHILLQQISCYLTLFSSTLLLILLFFLPPSERLLWYSLPSTHASPPGAPVTQLGFHL